MVDTVQLVSEAWKVMVERLPSSKIERSGGITSCIGHVPLFVLNASIVERPAATQDELRSFLNLAARRSTGPYPWGVMAREDWLPPGWEPVVQAAGLAPVFPMTGMETSELLPPRRPPAPLDIRRVENDAIARDLAHLNAHAYHMQADLYECICNMHLWQPGSFGYVGYADGRPVCCAAAFPALGTVYIAFVATLPEAQGKGYGETIVRHTIGEAQREMGTQITTLHASDMGLPVYLAMGYKAGARLLFFGPPHVAGPSLP